MDGIMHAWHHVMDVESALAPAWLNRVGHCRGVQELHDLPAVDDAVSATGEEEVGLVVCEAEARYGLEVGLVGEE